MDHVGLRVDFVCNGIIQRVSVVKTLEGTTDWKLFDVSSNVVDVLVLRLVTDAQRTLQTQKYRIN